MSKYILMFSLIFSISFPCHGGKRDTWQQPNQIFKSLRLDPNKDIICEIGAGDGYFSLKAISYAKHVFAIDINEKRLLKLKKKLEKKSIANITPVLATHDNTLLPPRSCDVIMMVIVYHHLENRVEYLKRLIPILKPGGRLVNIDNVYDVRKYESSPKRTPSPQCRYPRKKFLREAHEAGFKLIKSHSFLNVQYFEELMPANG